MRGGAIPALAWGTLLLVLAIGDWVWDRKPINGVTATFAVIIAYLAALLIAVRAGRRALRRGAPEPESAPEAIPQASSGAVMFAFGFAALAFGFTFGHFVVYFGAAVMVLGLGRVAAERRRQRDTLRQVAAHDPPRPTPPVEEPR